MEALRATCPTTKCVGPLAPQCPRAAMRPQSQAPSKRRIVAETHERLWGGRFAEAPDAATLRFMAGRDVTPPPRPDAHLVADDLGASAAHVAMLAHQGFTPPADARVLLDGLDELARRHE